MRGPSGGSYGISIPSMEIPVWLRLTRNGTNLVASTSSDGRNWDIFNQSISKFSTDIWVGLFIGNGSKPVGRDVMDGVTFIPGPSLSETLPAGVLLRSGSYLAGNFGQFDITGPASVGGFNRNGKSVSVSAAQIATVVLNPTTRRQIAKSGSKIGLLLKNGDFIEADIESIRAWDPDVVRINSLALGITEFGERFGQTANQAVFFHPLQPQPSDYEIRLTDGSIIRAASLGVSNGQLVISEVSGGSVTVDPNEIAQFRAGPARVQNLLEVPWKASPSPSANPAPAVNAASNTPAGTATNAAPIAAVPAASSENPSVECWEGNDQEQMMAAMPGTRVEFPLAGKFRALAMKIALSPDSPPNARATVGILADGREIGRTPPFKAGDQPAFIEIALQNPKTVTLVADSIFAGARVFFIDPVAIRGEN
jgi:hypothetical protein